MPYEPANKLKNTLFLTRRHEGHEEELYVAKEPFVAFVPLCEIELGCGLRPPWNKKMSTQGIIRMRKMSHHYANDPNVYLDGKERRSLDLRPYGVACIPLLGLSNFQMARTGTEEHVHEGCVEISLCLRGNLAFESDGIEYPFLSWPSPMRSKGPRVFLPTPSFSISESRPRGSISLILSGRLHRSRFNTAFLPPSILPQPSNASPAKRPVPFAPAAGTPDVHFFYFSVFIHLPSKDV